MITANDLAEELGINKSNLLKAAKKDGLVLNRVVVKHHGQPEAVFDKQQEKAMRERYKHLSR
jgi:hypothetical protein